MRVISNEVLAVENGTYSAKIVTVFDYGEDKVCMKFQMEDGTILVKFFRREMRSHSVRESITRKNLFDIV